MLAGFAGSAKFVIIWIASVVSCCERVANHKRKAAHQLSIGTSLAIRRFVPHGKTVRNEMCLLPKIIPFGPNQ